MKKRGKTILFVVDFPPPFGGVTVWNQRILEQFRNDKNIKLIAYSYKKKAFIDDIKDKNSFINALNIVIYVYYRIIKAFFSGIIKFSDIIRAIKHLPNIFTLSRGIKNDTEYILYTSHTSFRSLMLSFIADFNCNCSFVIHEHGSGILKYAEKRPKLVTYLLNRADKIVVTTEYMKSICKTRNSCKDNILIIPCGINIKEKLYCEEKKYITFCGSLEDHKDPMSFIRAIPNIIKMDIALNITFMVIGKGSLEKSLTEEAEKLNIKDNVIFTGELSNEAVNEILYKSKLFILPSKRESFGIVLIEALNNYTPCIITNVGGMPEIINKNIGRIVAVESPEMIADSIIEILSNETICKNMSMDAYRESLKYDMKLIKERMEKEVFNLS